MANDYTYVKGFRSNAAYFPETTYGTYSLLGSTQNSYKIGGKVRSINWSVRQNILKTGNIGDGRNYKQQLFGNYDASASITWEVGDFSFLRFAVGDIARFGASGASEASPFFLVESELTGIDGDGTSQGKLDDSDTTAYTTIRIRPFSMLVYDVENASGSTIYNESADKLMGCMINDFTLSAGLGSPLTCSTNLVVREIAFKRMLSSAEIPTWPGTAITTDYGFGYPTFTSAMSLNFAQQPPLMFYGGKVKVEGNEIAQVQSFNYTHNNGLLVPRDVTDRFIRLPTTGMRTQALTLNIIYRLPPAQDNMGGGQPYGSQTTILELLKNQFGWTSNTSDPLYVAFGTSTELRPALATTTNTTSPQTVVPIAKTSVELLFLGTNTAGTTRGAKITIYNLAVEGWGVPVTLENGMIEIPVTFNVKGAPYVRTGDGSYGGHKDGSTVGMAGYYATFQWWNTYA